MYGAISSDVLNRWVYPVTPDLATANGVKYSHLRHNVYIPKDVSLARGCSLEENVAVGHKTEVDTGTSIRRSVVGNSCKIGKNVRIDNSFLWNNVTVEDDCIISYAILADNVVIKKGVTISPGCVLSYNVVVGPNVVLPPRELLTAESQDDEPVDTKVYGASARAFTCSTGAEQTESDEEDEGVEQELWRLAVRSDVSDEDSSDMNESSDEELPDSPIPDDVNLFYKEVLDSLQRGVEEKIKCENLVLEVNSSKYAYNVTMKEVNMKVIAAILELPNIEKELSAQELLAKQLPLLTQLLPLIKNYIKNMESQLDCLAALEEYCYNHPTTVQILSKVISVLYDKDVLSEEAILRWFKQDNEDNLEEHKEIREKVYPLIKWLQEAEEESSSDDS
jgi:translation initiation factor eIF-2B subunit epsilon